MQAWIIDHYDTDHICNNCANGAAGILFAILLFVFPITLSLLTKKESPCIRGLYILFAIAVPCGLCSQRSIVAHIISPCVRVCVERGILKHNHVILPDPSVVIDNNVGEAASCGLVRHGTVIAGDLISVKHDAHTEHTMQYPCQSSPWHTLCKRYFLFFLCSRSRCMAITITATVDTGV